MYQNLPEWIQKQLPEGTENRYFSSAQGRIHYLTRGRGQQVVLVHGNPTWSFLWRRVMGELDPNLFKVIAPDLMNLGLSDDLPTNCSILESLHRSFRYGSPGFTN